MRLWGLLAHWEEVGHEPWVARVVEWQELEARRRSLEYRFGKAKLGAFKPMADFDWGWPKRVDRELVEVQARPDGFLNWIAAGPMLLGSAL